MHMLLGWMRATAAGHQRGGVGAWGHGGAWQTAGLVRSAVVARSGASTVGSACLLYSEWAAHCHLRSNKMH